MRSTTLEIYTAASFWLKVAHFARLTSPIGLYTSGEVTLGQAAEVAHLNQTQFLHELGHRNIPMNYGVEDFAQDLITIEKLRARR